MESELKACELCKGYDQLIALRKHGTRRIKIGDVDKGKPYVLLVECQRYRCPLCYSLSMDYSPAISKFYKFTRKFAEYCFNNPDVKVSGLTREVIKKAVKWWRDNK